VPGKFVRTNLKINKEMVCMGKSKNSYALYQKENYLGLDPTKQSVHQLKQEEESDGVEVDRRLVADDGGDQVEKERSEKTEQ
jgi:hypothetical protein